MVDVELNIDDLPKETCIELIRLYAKLMIALDGFWYLSLKERTNNDEALECDNWVSDHVMKYMVNDMARVVGVHGRDVVDFVEVMKVRQVASSPEIARA